MKRLSLFIFVLIVFSTFPVMAQFTVFESNRTHHQNVEFNASPSTDNIITNFIITEIARAIPKNIDITSFSVEFKSSLQLKQVDSVNYLIFYELKEMIFRGDVSYRNINIAHILTPDFVDFQLDIQRKDETAASVFKNSFSRIKLNDQMGYFTVLQSQFNDTVANAPYTASVNNLKLIWAEPVKERFLKAVALIFDYYQADFQIEELFKTVRKIDVNHIERVAFNNVVLRDAEKEYSLIMQRNFQNELNLWNSDPINFVSRMENLQREMSTVRFQINKKLEQLDRLYYEQGNQRLQLEKFDSARYFYTKAIEYNPVFVPALTELAYIDYRRGAYDTAATRIIYIHERAIPAQEDQNRLSEVTRLILSAIDETVQRRILSQDFVEAQLLLELSMTICTLVPQLQCFNDMDKLMAQVKYGLYRSLIVVIEKAIENKRFEIARIYIFQAIDYQKNNSKYIITSIEAEKYFEILYTACKREIDQLNIRKNYVKALETVEWLESYCDSLPSLDCSSLSGPKTVTLKALYNERLDKIEFDISKKNFVAAETRMKLLTDFVLTHEEIDFDNRYRNAEVDIQTFFYHTTISEAIANLENSFFEPAWNVLLKAYEIQEKYRLEKYHNIDSLARMAGDYMLPRFFINTISSANSYSILQLKNKHNEYAQYINKISYQLNDSLIQLQNKLNDIILVRICDSLNTDIQLLIFQSDSLANRQEFSNADHKLQSAVSVCQNNMICRLPIEDVLEQKVKIRIGVDWENEQMQMRSLINDKKWNKAIEHFHVIDKLSSSQLLFMWGVQRPSLKEFIIAENIADFSLAGFEYFYDNKLWDDAFAMLEHLRKMQYPVIQTIDQQTRAGHKLAVRDKIENPSANFKINILKYTEGEEYFLYFSKSYRKTWRKN